MSYAIETRRLTKHYGPRAVVNRLELRVPTGCVYGLLGRNGAGKSTLMKVITGQEFPTSGNVAVFGQNPLENDRILRRMVFVRESQQYPDIKVKHAIEAASWFFPGWDAELAEQLLADFALPRNRLIKKLSRGMHSAVGIVIGLAARAEITMFDEPYLGLDAVARQIFYDRLLADYAEHPRTVVLSTHLIDEVANLLEHVVVLDQGRIAIDAPTDDLRGNAVTVVGPARAVETFVDGRDVWHRSGIGSLASVTVAGPIANGQRAQADDLGLELVPVSLQQLVVHASGTEQAGERS